MLNFDVKRKINTLRDILVGKVPDPKSQVEQITIALIYKFMDDMDLISTEFGERQFFTGEYEKYAWSNIMNPQISGTEKAFLYMEGIEKMQVNPALPALFRSIFRGAFLPYRDPETLTMFLKEINDFSYENSEDLGNAYEYLLSIMGSQGDAGQFRTPRHIIDMIVEIVEPTKTDKILDPACGTAGFLISAYKYIMEHNKDKDGNSTLTADERERLTKNFAGYDISQDMVRLSRVNMYLHNFLEPNISEYDTLTSLEKWDDTFDVILANPPFMTPKGGIKPHNRFQIQAKRSEVLFVDYIAEHLNTGGRAGVIVPEGIVFQSANAYKDLRKMLVDNNYLYAVISLPAGVFNPYSGVKTSILLFDRVLAAKTDKILFVKIQNDGFDLGAQRREIKDNDIPKTQELIKKYKAALQEGSVFNLSENEQNYAILAAKKDISKQDYILVGDRYKETVVHSSKWPMVALGEVCEEIKSGFACGKSEKDSGEILHLRPMNISSKGTLVFEGSKFISKDEFNDAYAIKSGDVLFNNTNSKELVGKTCYIPNNINAGYSNHITRIRTMEILNSQYLAIILQNLYERGYFLNLCNKWVGQAGINNKVLSGVKIPLPPLSVQEQIVAEIESYQKIIDGAKQVIDNYKPTIKIDPEWEMVELGEVCDVNAEAINPAETFGEKEFIYIDISSVENETGFIKYDNILIGKQAPSRARRKVRNGDILLSTVRPNLKAFGYVNFVNVDNCVASTGFAVLTPKNAENKYIFYIIFQNYVLNQMITAMGKGAYPSINQNDVNALKIPLPPLEVQQRIVEQIDEEQAIVNQNKRLIEIFEQKIKDKISEVWGEEKSPKENGNIIKLPESSDMLTMKYAARNCTDKFIDAVKRHKKGDKGDPELEEYR